MAPEEHMHASYTAVPGAAHVQSFWSKVFSGSWVALHLLLTGTLGEKSLVQWAHLGHCLLCSRESITNCPLQALTQTPLGLGLGHQSVEMLPGQAKTLGSEE